MLTGPVALPNDWWTNGNCAAALGISYSTWTAYVSRGQAPEPDRWFGRTPTWRPDTIRAWAAARRT
jgi:predicted DNA-binding transcriptional regulator AlpA